MSHVTTFSIANVDVIWSIYKAYFLQSCSCNNHNISMEEKILNAMQQIRSKCKRWITSQVIYSIVNKDRCFISLVKLIPKFMFALKTDGYILKEVKENLPYILLQKTLLIGAVMKRIRIPIMGSHCSKMNDFPPFRRLRRSTKILKMRILSYKKFRKTLLFYIIITLYNFITTKGKLRMFIWTGKTIVRISSYKRKLLF